MPTPDRSEHLEASCAAFDTGERWEAMRMADRRSALHIVGVCDNRIGKKRTLQEQNLLSNGPVFGGQVNSTGVEVGVAFSRNFRMSRRNAVT
jgi:hypothetical protein